MRRASRTLSLLASLTACSALAGCGGSSSHAPALAHADARQLIALARQVEAAHAPCTQQRAIARLRSAASELVNAGRVPPELQETLSSGVNALVADEPACLPTLTAETAVTTTAHVQPAPVRIVVRPGGDEHPHPGPPGHDHRPGPGGRGHGPGPGPHGDGHGGDG